MAGSKTAYLAQRMLEHVLGGTAYTKPATVYIALSTAAFNPNATGSAMTEVSAGDYVRLAVTNDLTKWSGATAASPSEKHNAVDFTWSAATSSWGTPQSVYVADAASAGNVLYGADISNAQLINSGDTAKVAASTFVFDES